MQLTVQLQREEENLTLMLNGSVMDLTLVYSGESLGSYDVIHRSESKPLECMILASVVKGLLKRKSSKRAY